ncbi:hypothetical protein [Butyrivibrio sp. FCS014]|uniref:hypothetical protein n=1 Tax=Butyrivibrio sp. FCS014 TaxID=1408304 RepID=UPI0004BBAA77|nr:hypothetical protein [Butyrivibrio sp. FCS014]
MEKDIKAMENKDLEKELKDQKVSKENLSDDELDQVNGGLDVLQTIQTIKDIILK